MQAIVAFFEEDQHLDYSCRKPCLEYSIIIFVLTLRSYTQLNLRAKVCLAVSVNCHVRRHSSKVECRIITVGYSS